MPSTPKPPPPARRTAGPSQGASGATALPTAATTSKPPGARADAQTRVPAQASGAPAGATQPEAKSPPYLQKAKDVLRLLAIAEKNFHLFPVKGHVAQAALKALHEAIEAFHEDAADELLLAVREQEFLYQEAVVFRDDTHGKSLPFRLYREGIRHLTFREGTTPDELSDLLVCFKEARTCDEGEEGLLTLFWEKESTHIHFEVVDDFIEEDEDAAIVQPSATFLSSFDPRRFGIDPAEEKQLRSILATQEKSHSDGDDRFELNEAETEALQAMVREEKGYFALQDFVGLLLEYMAHHPDPKQFAHALHLIRTLIFSMIENLEFGNAEMLLEQVRRAEFVGMSESHRVQIGDLRRSFGDKVTFQIVRSESVV